MTGNRGLRIRNRLLAVLLGMSGLVSCGPARENRVVVGSKNFSEQLVLGELIAQQIENTTSLAVERRFYLAGTYICHQSLLAGRIDIYPEYTGTALTAILKQKSEGSPQKVYEQVREEYAKRFHLEAGSPFGFDNTFAIQIRGEDARRLGVKTTSQAARYAPQWHAGFGYEFMERPDGYKGWAATYGLRFAGPPSIMDLGLLDRALKEKQVDLIAGNMTDGLIPALDLFVLEDDRHYFPPYEAVPIIRQETLRRHPEIERAMEALAGKISTDDMRAMNYAIDGQHRDVKDVVREFLARSK